ncbi:MAG: DUF4340 domain-containing protein [Deltaproteobacteria bacterium]|nr:DUF4340 domain-containing protein [Deltaproteobacteria bacterium]
MKRWSILLGICLAVQMALAVGVNLARTDYTAFEPTETLLSADPKTVDDIRIQGSDEQVELKKQDGEWRISSQNNFQSDQDKVKAFLDKLLELKKGWPVATTSAAAKRFKVAEENFERKITLSREDKKIDTLYIGTSPGFRKVYARNKDEKPVYAVNFNDYEVGTKSGDWIDKWVLKHQVSDISHVRLPDFSMSRRDGKLAVEGIDENTEETVVEEAERLLRKIADLCIRSTILGDETKSEYKQDNPDFSYTLALSAGESETYVFSKPKDANYYVLKPSHRAEYFKVDKWVVDSIKEVSRSKLVRKKEDAKKGTKEEDSTK